MTDTTERAWPVTNGKPQVAPHALQPHATPPHAMPSAPHAAHPAPPSTSRRADMPIAEGELDADLARLVRRTSVVRQGFYIVVLLVALAGQVSGAVEALGIPLAAAIPAVAALELGGIVVLTNADVRRRLGERAVASRLLSVAIAAGAVTFNWVAHTNHLLGAFFAGMSALGYLVWLMHTENQRRDRLRVKGDLPPTTPSYEVGGHWLRHPLLTMRAKGLAKADPRLGLYDSLATARAEIRRERRQSAIAKVLHRKIRAAVDPRTADIAIAVYDLDEIAARLADRADYDGLTSLIAADLAPARLAPQGRLTERPTSRRGRRSKSGASRDDIETSLNPFGPLPGAGTPGGAMPRFIEPAGVGFGVSDSSGSGFDGAGFGEDDFADDARGAFGRGDGRDAGAPRNTDRTSVRIPVDGGDQPAIRARETNGHVGGTGFQDAVARGSGAGGPGANGSGAGGSGTSGSGTSGSGVSGSGTNGSGTNGSGTNGSGTNGSGTAAANGRHAVPGQNRVRGSRNSNDALTGPTGSQSSLFTDLRRDLSHLQPARSQASTPSRAVDDEAIDRESGEEVADFEPATAELSLRRRVHSALDANVLPGDQRDDTELLALVFDELRLTDLERLSAASYVHSWLVETQTGERIRTA